VTEKQRKWVAGQFTAASVRAGFYGRSMPRRERVSFHTLRHTCATWMHERGVDPFTAMMVLRHRSVGQTANYSHVSVDQARTAVGKVLPFRRTEQAS